LPLIRLRAPRPWSGVLIAALALWTLAEVVSTFVLALRPSSEFGIDLATGGIVQSVTAGSAAAAAGIARGDRVLLDRLSETDRSVMEGAYKPPGTTVALTFVHDRAAHSAAVTSRAVRSHPNWATLLASGAAAIVLVGVGLWLVLARPNGVTWSFYVFACGYAIVQFGSLVSFLHGSAVQLYAIPLGLSLAMAIGGGSIFTARFPSGVTTAAGRLLERVTLPATALVAALFAAGFWMENGAPPALAAYAGPTGIAYNVVLVAILVLNVIAILYRHANAVGEEKARGQWVIAGSSVAVIALIVASVLRVVRFHEFDGSPLDVALRVAIVCIPLSVAYAVLRHRVIDVRFALSRALVFGILTTGLVLAFSLVEWLLGKELAATRVALYVDLALALVIGFSFDRLKQLVDRGVERAFFRRERAAADRLQRATDALPHAGAPETVDDLLTSEPMVAYGLSSAALFRRASDGTFSRAMALGWDAAAGTDVAEGDPLLAYLAARTTPFELDGTPHAVVLPLGAAQPVLAVPVAVRSQLLAFALYGPHATGETLDPGERAMLGGLAVAAAAAYDHLEAQALRRELGAARRELDELRSRLA